MEWLVCNIYCEGKENEHTSFSNSSAHSLLNKTIFFSITNHFFLNYLNKIQIDISLFILKSQLFISIFRFTILHLHSLMVEFYASYCIIIIQMCYLMVALSLKQLTVILKSKCSWQKRMKIVRFLLRIVSSIF